MKHDGVLEWMRRHLQCAVCDKAVDDVQKDLSPTDCRIRFTAVCHGQRETTVVDEEFLELFGGDVRLSLAPAFERLGIQAFNRPREIEGP